MSNEQSWSPTTPSGSGGSPPVFVRRRIGFGRRRRRRSSCCVRPDSRRRRRRRRRRVVRACARGDRQGIDERQAGDAPRASAGAAAASSRVDVPGVEPTVDPRRAALERRARCRRRSTRLRDAGAVAEPNHVVLGSQGVRGMPVGAEAHFAGGMMFTAELIDTADRPGAEDDVRPGARSRRGCRQPLGLGGPHGAAGSSSSTPGCAPTAASGAAVEHPYLTCARLHSPWLRDRDRRRHRRRGRVRRRRERHARLRGRPRHVHHRHHPADLPGRRGAHRRRAVELRRRRRRQRRSPRSSSRVDQAGPFDIVVMSLGGYMSDDDGELFGDGLGRLLGDGLGVAAAGNQSTSRPYFPAALARRSSASAALGQADKAWFTNFGGWVDACAPAIDVVSTFFLGDPTRSSTSRRSPAGPAGAARASRRRRWPPPSPRRCT